MTQVTDEDREKAAEIAGWPAKNWTELRDAIAAALAEEREKARAPFLALADEYDDIWQTKQADPTDVTIAATFRATANDIRRAIRGE